MMKTRSPRLVALLMAGSLFAAALPMASATLAANAQVVMGKSVGIARAADAPCTPRRTG
jgi:hypothetical protein